MKKLLLLFSLVAICSIGYSQNVKVNINNQDATIKDDCPYRINGICASEDIGGVEVEFLDGEEGTGTELLVLTNYNNFKVNVLWQIDLDGFGSITRTGYTILGREEQKKITITHYLGGYWTVKGLIVRKLTQ